MPPIAAARASMVLAQLVLLCCLVTAGQCAQQVEEPVLKVAYLYNFSKYVHWPQDGPPSSPPEPFDICVIRGERLRLPLKQLEKRSVGGRPIITHLLSGLPRQQVCEMVYFVDSSRSEVAAALKRLAGRPVLTVADLTGFAVQGGMIELTREDDRIRFRINVDKIREAGLRVSSRLLKLATIVREMEF
ncbi:MAG TPA: YfiR family protein [Desulfobulbus sp.]|nr:YfiR family protein [Desulfobulbus sp.]